MTIQVNLGEARRRFDELVEAALKGENVIIARRGKPQVELEPIAKSKR